MPLGVAGRPGKLGGVFHPASANQKGCSLHASKVLHEQAKVLKAGIELPSQAHTCHARFEAVCNTSLAQTPMEPDQSQVMIRKGANDRIRLAFEPPFFEILGQHSETASAGTWPASLLQTLLRLRLLCKALAPLNHPRLMGVLPLKNPEMALPAIMVHTPASESPGGL